MEFGDDYFSLNQLLSAVLWFIVILAFSFVRKARYSEEDQTRYMLNIFVKLVFSLAFTLFYIVVIKGGDTIAYFEGARAMNNLFLESPERYFDQMMTTPGDNTMSNYFTATTGYPPGWIYREPEGFFVSKLVSLLSIFTLKSYLATALLVAYIAASASWKLYLLLKEKNFVSERYLVIGVLFLPSVNFWCTGISKDSIVYICVLLIVYHSFKLISAEGNKRIRSIVVIILSAFIIYHMRSVILYALVLALSLAYSAAIIKRLSGGRQAIIASRVVILLGGLVFIGQSLVVSSEEEFLAQNSIFNEAQIIQNDFATNELYGDKRYSIGTIEYTPFGLVRAMPFAIIAGVFRPFIWEALSPSLILNGFESILLIYLLFLFFAKNFRDKIRYIQSSEFLIFALTFVVLMAFITGLTSSLFGVLVRLRAPLLPFVIILLALVIKKDESTENSPLIE